MKVAVIGAGAVGMATALQLLHEGHAVTIYDERAPGTACSYGNSGGIGIGLVAPIAMPGIGRQVPRLLLDRDEPLFIDPRHPLRKLPWFWRFWRASRRAEVERISAARASLNRAVMETLTPLLERADAQDLIVHKGMLFVFEGTTPSDGAQMRFAIGRRHGIEARALARAELHDINPDLAADLNCAVLIPGNRHCLDPGALVGRFAAAFAAGGGTLRRESVRNIVPGDGLAIETATGRAPYDRIVVAAGAWSRPFATALGVKVLLESERGYHLMLPSAGLRIGVPTTLADRNVVMTPMADGLRITGIAEFAEPDAPPRWERADNLLVQARRYFPAIDGTGARRWVGPRPSTPDSLPVIGPAPGHPGIIFAFGHGQSGLAHASVTARLVADCLARRPPLIAMQPFAPDRFGRA